MLKYILSWIWKKDDDILSLEEAYKTLNEELDDNVENNVIKAEEDVIEETFQNYETLTKTGIITEINNNIYKIDERYSFECNEENKFVVGSTVSFQLFSSGGEFKVCNVQFVENDWNLVDSKVKGSWHMRTIVCNVSKRAGRMVTVIPGDILINLNKVSSQFVPIVGDWIELEVKCEVDENVVDLNGKILEITRINALRSQIKSGQITQWNRDEYEGVISRNVFFNKDSLYAGYIPCVGDNVVAEIIESNQRNCIWRAVKIIPDYLTCKGKTIFYDISAEEFDTTHEGLTITDDIHLTFTKLGEVKLFTIDIECTKKFKLVSIEIPKANGQCKLVSDFDHFDLIPEEPITLRTECRAKHIGETREIMIFHFEDFKIARWIHINVRDITPKNKKTFQKSTKQYQSWSKRETICGGQVKLSPRFQSFYLPEYSLPERIKNLVIQHYALKKSDTLKQELEKIKPSLIAQMNFMNYEDKLHSFLHLDEAVCLIEMSNYDQERACFIRNGEFLMLEIDNLAEKRPSVIVGDKVVARNLFDSTAPDHEGFIHKTGKNHVYIKFNQVFHESYNNEDYAIKVIASRTTYRREHHAVHLAMRNLGKDWLFPTQIHEKPPQIEFTFDKYCDNFNQSVEISKNNYKSPTRSKDLYLEKIRKYNANNKEELSKLKLEWYNEHLNFFQKEAVRNVLLGVCRPLPYIIFGPPGTGKTVTLVEIILQTLRLMPHSRLLVVAPSNSAADLMALRLIGSGVVKPGDLIRLVSYTAVQNISARLAPYCATANIEREGTQSTLPVVTPSGLVLGYSSSVIGRHRITVTTCSNAAVLFNMGFSRGHFSHIIVDEAGQTSEPSVLIPLSFLDTSSGYAVLAGDPMQLGPVILSKLAADYGLEESLLERFINRFPYLRDIHGFPNTCGYDPRLITKLIYNYRSLPDILKLSSRLFYNDDLLSTICPNDSKEALFLEKIRDVLPQLKNGKPGSLMFHGVVGQNFQTEDSPSWYNPNEAAQVFYYVNEFYRLGCEASDIGVITPYKAQTKQLLDLFKEADFDVPKLGTVEEFQGQESKIIILSTVRSSKKHVNDDLKYSLGFISSPRRLNVSITRAKSLMLIIGNSNLLVEDRCWRAVIEYCIEMGTYVGSPLTNKLE